MRTRIQNAALNCFPALPNNLLGDVPGPLQKKGFRSLSGKLDQKNVLENKKSDADLDIFAVMSCLSQFIKMYGTLITGICLLNRPSWICSPVFCTPRKRRISRRLSHTSLR